MVCWWHSETLITRTDATSSTRGAAKGSEDVVDNAANASSKASSTPAVPRTLGAGNGAGAGEGAKNESSSTAVVVGEDHCDPDSRARGHRNHQ
eukprot:SAG25_NODE_640_length_6239_cov_3.197557_4_plen_93_part_00